MRKILNPGICPGKTTIKEFVPKTPGIYKFSCWMGMVTGTIEAVDEKGQSGGVVESGNSGNSSPTTGSCGCSQNR